VSTLTIREFGVKKSFAKEVNKDYFIATTIAAAILKKCPEMRPGCTPYVLLTTKN
jgi:hypothetical protein